MSRVLPGFRRPMIPLDSNPMGAAKNQPWMLAAILLLGCSLRLVTINRWPLWGDEALTLVVSTWPVETLLFKSVDPTPGLYYLLHKLLLSSDTFNARIASVVFGTATIAASYLVARVSRAPALTAASLAALSFPLIDYSQEARAYALLILLTTLSAWAFIRWEQSKCNAALAVFVGFNILALYTHPIALFWVVPASATILLTAGNATLKNVVIALCLQTILFAPELGRLRGYPSEGFVWLKHASAGEMLGTLGYAFLPLGISEATATTGAAIIATVLLFAVLLWRAWIHRNELISWQSENRGASYALLILISSPLMIWAAGFAKPIFMPRTILIGVPAFLVALSVLMSFERHSALLVVLALYAIALTATGTVRDKYGWRRVAASLEENVQPGDVILVCPAWEAPALRAALTKPLPAPMFGRSHEKLILIEPKVGSDPMWANTYRRILADGKAFPAVPASRVWTVVSECH